jgi:hypothetical protein
MKRGITPFLLCVGIFWAGFVFAGEPKVKKRDPTIFFWYHFRTAVMSNNFPEFQKLTHFPFETTAPDGSIVRNSKKTFLALYRPLLDTPGKNGKTMRDIITEKEDLSAEERDRLKEGEIQVGSFHFQMVKNKCYFVGAGLRSTAEPQTKSLPAVPVDVPPVSKEVQKEVPKAVVPEPVLEPTEEPLQDSVFRFYWVAFRQAVLDNNVSKVKSLTRFPFETKGPLEEDKKKKFIAKEFDLLWPRLLETDPHSWGPLRDSMRELIVRREEPRVEEISTEPTGKIQVGAFLFQKIKNRWYFTRAIVAE